MVCVQLLIMTITSYIFKGNEHSKMFKNMSRSLIYYISNILSFAEFVKIVTSDIELDVALTEFI